MKKILLLSLLVGLTAIAEPKITYSYDKAGNRTLRTSRIAAEVDPGFGKDTAIHVIGPGINLRSLRSASSYSVHPNPTTDGIVQVQSVAPDSQQDAIVEVYTTDAILVMQERLVEGAVTGFALGSAWQFAPMITWNGLGLAIQTGMTIYGTAQMGIGLGGTILGGITHGKEGFINGAKTFLGNFYLDENNWFGGALKGVSRHTWEFLQTFAGHTYSQIRNVGGNVSRVDYLGGATFVTDEHTEDRWGVTIGNYINIKIMDGISGNFRDRVISDPLFMHEYGHTIDSWRFGPLYLIAVGLPSLGSVVFGNDHRRFYTEIWANRNAKAYFGKYYGIDWNRANSYYTSAHPFEEFYPTHH